MKKRPSQMIIDIYRTNRDRLSNELDKDVKDRSTNNAIAAYRHIVAEMEKAYDLSFVYTDPNTVNPNGATDRLMLMRDIGWRLNFYFEPGDIPDAAGRVFAVAPSPNPFNPATKLSYTVRHPGRLVMKVYDIRGRLVRTLIDRQVAEDGFVMWDGTDGAGGQVASGVYFVEARMGTEVKINKVALVK